MKKLIFTMAFLCAALITFAQASVVNAYNAMQSADFVKAAEYIEKAMNDSKAISKDKTWRYRGQIYLALATSDEHKSSYPNAIAKSFESFQKAIELDTKERYKEDHERGINNVQIVALNSGVEDFNNKDYMAAINKFTVSEAVATSRGQVDTLAIYNKGLAYEKSGMTDEAIKIYKQCADLKYNVPNIYTFISYLQRDKGDVDGALETLQEARKDYPREQALLIEQLNIYLNAGRMEEAKENLEIAVENDPDNEILHFSLGSVYDNLGNNTEAEDSYKKALAVNPDYFDANYNLGALYYNRAVEMVNKANEIPQNQVSKYKAALAEANGVFLQARPYLETAHEVNPDDVSTMESLKNVYIRTGEDDKYNKIKEKMEAAASGE